MARSRFISLGPGLRIIKKRNPTGTDTVEKHEFCIYTVGPTSSGIYINILVIQGRDQGIDGFLGVVCC
jgi:hypothetical protein